MLNLSFKQFFRYGLLFATLVLLLTCYQVVGNSVISAFSSRREATLWLHPAGQKLDEAERKGPTRISQTDTSYQDFEVIAPPDRTLVLAVNGIEMGRRQSIGVPIRFGQVRLREGMNEVTAVLLGGTESESKSSTARIESRPSEKKPVIVLTTPYRDPENGHLIVGALIPPWFSGTWLQNEEGRGLYIGNKSGIAVVDAGIPSDSPLHVEAAWNQAKAQMKIWPVLGEAVNPATGPTIELAQGVLRRSVAIEVLEDDSFKIEARLLAPSPAAVFDWVRNKQITPEEIFNTVFSLSLNPWYEHHSISTETFEEIRPYLLWTGNFQVNDFLPSSSSLDSSVDTSGNELILHLNAKVPSTGIQLRSGDIRGPDECRLTVSNRSQVEVLVSSDWHGNSSDLNVSQLKQFQPLLVIRPGSSSAAEESDSGSEASEGDPEASPSGGNLLTYLRNVQNIVPQFLRTLLIASIGAVPFVWVLYVIGKADLPKSYVKNISAACAVFLILHFTITSVYSLRVGLESLNLGDLFHKPNLTWDLRELGTYYPYLAIAVVILLRPIYEAYRVGPSSTKPSRWRAIWQGMALSVSLVFSMAVAAFPLFIPASLGPVDRATVILPAISTSAAVLLFWIPLRLAIVSLIGVRVRAVPVFLASLAMLALPAIPPSLEYVSRQLIWIYVKHFNSYPRFTFSERSGTLWRWIVALLGAMLLFEVVRLIFRTSYWRSGNVFIQKKTSRWLIIPLMIAAIPAWYAGRGPVVLPGQGPGIGRIADVYDFSSFAKSLDKALPYAILPGVLFLMRLLNRRDSYKLSPEIVSCGCLLFAYYLSGQNITVLFIPIPVIVGYALFRWFLLHPTVGPEYSTDAGAVAPFLDLKNRQALARQRRKTLEKKFVQAEIGPAIYSLGIIDTNEFLNAATGAFGSVKNSNIGRIFSLGPETGPWRNALISTTYGLALSIPFQLSALAKILRSPAGDFPFVFLALRIMQSMVLWALEAFVFGYFFHVIRGSNGFQKAINFIVALSVPTILLRLAMDPQVAARTQMIEFAQLAAFILLLALFAFDLRVLQNAGFSWRDLPSIYGLTASAAYLGSVVLSLVSAAAQPVLKEWIVHLFHLK